MDNNVSAINGMMGNAPARKVRKLYEFQQNSPLRQADSVKISNDVMTIRGAEQLRQEKIMQVREKLNNGTYVTAANLDTALDRAIDDALRNL